MTGPGRRGRDRTSRSSSRPTGSTAAPKRVLLSAAALGASARRPRRRSAVTDAGCWPCRPLHRGRAGARPLDRGRAAGGRDADGPFTAEGFAAATLHVMRRPRERCRATRRSCPCNSRGSSRRPSPTIGTSPHARVLPSILVGGQRVDPALIDRAVGVRLPDRPHVRLERDRRRLRLRRTAAAGRACCARGRRSTRARRPDARRRVPRRPGAHGGGVHARCRRQALVPHGRPRVDRRTACSRHRPRRRRDHVGRREGRARRGRARGPRWPGSPTRSWCAWTIPSGASASPSSRPAAAAAPAALDPAAAGDGCRGPSARGAAGAARSGRRTSAARLGQAATASRSVALAPRRPRRPSRRSSSVGPVGRPAPSDG